ncbi:MAG: ABC transporter permease [Candidatus Merdivicinus sp.]|jgi:putative ABC transport system permease protein
MESIKDAWRSIFRQPSRSILTVLSIAIGVFSVLIIGTISDLGTGAVRSELDSLGMRGITINTESGSGCLLTEEELNLVQTAAGVVEATPLTYSYTEVLVRGSEIKGMVWGVDANVTRIISLNLLYGRTISRADVLAGNRVCLVEQSFVQEMYRRDNAVGKTLRIRLNGRDEEFTIIGVVEAGGNILQSFMGDYVPMFLYLPYTAQQECTGRQGFDRIAVQLKDGADAARVGTLLSRSLDSRFGQSGAISVDNFSQYADQFTGILDTVSTVLSVIAGISLLVAGLSIMTVMLSSVGERTREIGVKKSIGASSAIIVREFLLEAGFLSLLGSIAGTGAGILAGWLGCLLMGIPYSVRPGLIAACIGCALLTGMIFGAYPAKKAAALRPVEALRHE